MPEEQAPPARDNAAAAFDANERSWNAEVIAEFRANYGDVSAEVFTCVVREPHEVPGVVELVRGNYERATAFAPSGSTTSVNPASG
jgi:hypothetical protein